MDGVVCKRCRRKSSVPPSSQNIRCGGCRMLLLPSVEYNQYSETSWSHDQENVKTEAKGIRSRIREIFSDSNYSCYHQNVNESATCLSIDTSKPPPRGKRAFICGVTYKRQKMELKGAARDLKNIKDLLVKRFNFPDQSILVLAEEEKYKPPTRKNIEEGLEWLTMDIKPGDSLVFYFSGHGLRQRVLIGDELDGFDETICPVDFKTKGMIFDNHINKTIVTPLTPGVRLHAIIDSCHSGTMLDLPYVYNSSTRKWESNNSPHKGTSGGMAICFSACEDYQLAADTTALSPDKRMAGAMTSALINAVKESDFNNQMITYESLLDSMAEALNKPDDARCIHTGVPRIFRRKILQDPILSSSEEFNTSIEFKL